MIVLYDADCGFCRWAMAWALRLDRGHVLAAVAIQSPRGSELLGDLLPSERLLRVHAVGEDGHRSSGGAAAANVLSVLAPTRVLGRLARRSPRVAELLYDALAARRRSFGRLLGKDARRRADQLLGVRGSSGASTAAEPELQSRSET